MVELGDNAPRGGTFTGFGSDPAISGTSVLFAATTNYTGSTTVGLFLNTGGTITEIVNTGDTLFGSTVNTLGFYPSAFDGNQIAFSYSLADGTAGVGLVNISPVPEPATWMAGTGLLGLTACAWKRRRNAAATASA